MLQAGIQHDLFDIGTSGEGVDEGTIFGFVFTENIFSNLLAYLQV